MYIYLHDLSTELDFENCPMLLDQIISHLLWADDLILVVILLALDHVTLQKQLNCLDKFCTEWGVADQSALDL